MKITIQAEQLISTLYILPDRSQDKNVIRLHLEAVSVFGLRSVHLFGDINQRNLNGLPYIMHAFVDSLNSKITSRILEFLGKSLEPHETFLEESQLGSL